MKTRLLLKMLCLMGCLFFASLTCVGEVPIEELAAKYGNQSKEVVDDYNNVLSGDRLLTPHAIDRLVAKKAFPILARALPSVDLSEKHSIIEALSQSEIKDALVINALLTELKKLNYSDRDLEGEEQAAVVNTREILIDTCARLCAMNRQNIHVDKEADLDKFIKAVQNNLVEH